jgi:hypothetical protein
MAKVKCRNCGEEIRRTQPGDGPGYADGYEWVHVYKAIDGREIANPACMTMVAEPPAQVTETAT